MSPKKVFNLLKKNKIGSSDNERRISIQPIPPDKIMAVPPKPPPRSPKTGPDRTPHEQFVELEELHQTSYGGLQWKETARWIKYEEDVEGPDNRWGRPHIACINFNALFHLRRGLEQGILLLDLDESDYSNIANIVVDSLLAAQQISPEVQDSVLKVLLLRHKHTKESTSAFRRASRFATGFTEDGTDTVRSTSSAHSRRSSTRKSLHNIFRKTSSSGSFDDGTSKDNQSKDNFSRHNSMAQLGIPDDDRQVDKEPMNLHLLKKLPEDAEATVVLIGALDFLTKPMLALVRLANSVPMENVIEAPLPVRFLFFLLGPYDIELDYREMGRAFSTMMANREFQKSAYEAESRGHFLMAITEFLNSSIVFPPTEWKNNDLIPIDEIRNKADEIRKKVDDLLKSQKSDDKELRVVQVQGPAIPPIEETPKRNPLQRKGKPFYGLIQDVKIRYSQYFSDIKDGISPQVLSACIFIFFASLSPSITFGGIYGQKTQKYIGVGETLLATSINGIIFALFAAQPLLIVGSTGPLMIFDMSLLNFCNSMDLDYLSIRVWIGVWILVIGILVAAFEVVAIVKHFSRFLEEIFSTLVCIIFIYGAFENLVSIFIKHPLGSSTSCFRDLNHTNILHGVIVGGKLVNGTNEKGEEVSDDDVLVNQPNTALLSLCLMIATFLIATKLKQFRNSTFLSRGVRRALGDFGVPIAIFLMVLTDFFIKDTYTDKLSMPKGLKPSNAEVRGWLINPFGVVKPLPVWCIFAAAPASILLFILIFIEENICHLILSKPERCLKKGSGFHMDILLSCFVNTISGFLGAPFMGPACVRTIAHMSSLTLTSTNVAPGESHKIVGCIEQRVSSLTVAILVGLSTLLYVALNLVPRAVLLGIFLYMGVSATAGIQLLERVILFFMPVKYFPNVPYVRHVRALKMHLFTAIQVAMLVILWVIKQSPASLAVPFVLMCLIPIRLYILPRIFTTTELIALDGSPQTLASQSKEEEPDFYETAHDLPSPEHQQKS